MHFIMMESCIDFIMCLTFSKLKFSQIIFLYEARLFLQQIADTCLHLQVSWVRHRVMAFNGLSQELNPAMWFLANVSLLVSSPFFSLKNTKEYTFLVFIPGCFPKLNSDPSQIPHIDLQKVEPHLSVVIYRFTLLWSPKCLNWLAHGLLGLELLQLSKDTVNL